MDTSNVPKTLRSFLGMLLLLSGSVYGDTHSHVQAVNADGYGTHPDLQTTNKVAVEGIILNRPDFMLDATPDQNALIGPGAMWQIYVQGEGNDHAGTAVWMGQCYDNIWGNGTYTDQEWLNEIYRLNHDPYTGYEFAPGDRVRVTGLLKFYGGKTNINERHNTDPTHDFTIELIEPAVGLPQPEVIALDDVKDANDEFIFDPNRERGCEYYQGRLVKINDVNFVDANSWGPNAEMVITNGQKTFPLKLGLGWGFRPGSNNLSQPFDVVGIFDQEGGLKDNYRIWATNYDGNGKVLTDRAYGRYNLPGEIDMDGKVDFLDLAWLAGRWLECVSGTGACGGGSN
jgi:hypothetical protein